MSADRGPATGVKAKKRTTDILRVGLRRENRHIVYIVHVHMYMCIYIEMYIYIYEVDVRTCKPAYLPVAATSVPSRALTLCLVSRLGAEGVELELMPVSWHNAYARVQ